MAPTESVSRADWIAARKELLAKEKEATRLRDELAAARRALPRVRVETDYRFRTPAGERTLADLFDGRSQLIVQHFMFAPDWEAGCTGCSFMADHVDRAVDHLHAYDTGYVAVARAPVEKLSAYWRRMGWRFPFASSEGSRFNYDFDVSFTPEQLAGDITYNFATVSGPETGMSDLPGVSVFLREADGTIYHTYSSYGRGVEEVLGAYMLLDLTPKGRAESGPMERIRRHDEYAA